MSARVSVIIPNWNRASLLNAALAGLGRQPGPADEILVVDNGSSDQSIELAAKAGARVIELRENSGFCRAVNEGIRAASGDWIVILNNDVEMGDEWLAILLDRAIARDAWFATRKLIAASRPTHLDGARHPVCSAACAWRCGTARPDGPTWNNERPIRFAPFTAALFRAA